MVNLLGFALVGRFGGDADKEDRRSVAETDVAAVLVALQTINSD